MEALLLLDFSLLHQRPSQRRPLQIMLHSVGLPPLHFGNSQIGRRIIPFKIPQKLLDTFFNSMKGFLHNQTSTFAFRFSIISMKLWVSLGEISLTRCSKQISNGVRGGTCDRVHQVGQPAQDELAGHEAVERFGAEEVLLVAAALLQSEHKEVLYLLLLAVGQHEGLADLVRRVNGLEDARHRFRLFQFLEIALLLLLGEQVQKHPAV